MRFLGTAYFWAIDNVGMLQILSISYFRWSRLFGQKCPDVHSLASTIMQIKGKAIARYVGTSACKLLICHYDDYEGWEVLQYYDIPSQYEVPDGSVSVAKGKAEDK